MIFSRRLLEVERKLAPLLAEQKLLEKALRDRMDDLYVSAAPVAIGKINTTSAAHLHRGMDNLLDLGTMQMEWNRQSDEFKTGYISFKDPNSKLPRWEFSPLDCGDFAELEGERLRARFYGMNDPNKPKDFGYQSLVVKVGQMIIARHRKRPDKVYIIKFDEQQNGRVFVSYVVIESNGGEGKEARDSGGC